MMSDDPFIQPEKPEKPGGITQIWIGGEGNIPQEMREWMSGVRAYCRQFNRPYRCLNGRQCKALLDELGKKFDRKGKSVAELYTYAAQKCAALVPTVLKEHRTDVFSILAVLNETTVEAVAKQNILATIEQVREVFKDKALLDFFKSFGQEGETE